MSSSTYNSDDSIHHKPLLSAHSNAMSRPSRPKIILRWRGARRLPVVHLGGKKPRRGFFLARLFRRVRLGWLRRLRYSCILRRLKQYYQSLIKDLIEASASMEAYQQRVLMETSMAMPVMGVSFSNYHGGGALRSPKSIIMM